MLNTTKHAFADALKRRLLTEKLDRVTVTEIAQDCGSTRQTFYYHFKDIYDLVEWIYKTEAVSLLENHRAIDTWQEGYRLILDWMQTNRHLVMNTFASISREYLETFIYDVLYPMILEVVSDLAAGMDVAGKTMVTASDKEFIARFYTLALEAISLDWVREGMRESPASISEQVETVMKDNFVSALQKYAEKG